MNSEVFVKWWIFWINAEGVR